MPSSEPSAHWLWLRTAALLLLLLLLLLFLLLGTGTRWTEDLWRWTAAGAVSVSWLVVVEQCVGRTASTS